MIAIIMINNLMNFYKYKVKFLNLSIIVNVLPSLNECAGSLKQNEDLKITFQSI